jgi:hypothetical protein
MPDYFFSDLRSPNSSFATNAPEDFAVDELRYRQPVINAVLYPIWHWDRTDVPAFSYPVNDCPMIFAALDVVKCQINGSLLVFRARWILRVKFRHAFGTQSMGKASV